MSKVITFGNHKGGVGKTTSALNVSAGLHKLGYKVLMIDIDSQANLSQSVGFYNNPNNMYEAFKNALENDVFKINPTEVLKGWDIVPSVIDLMSVEKYISAEAGGEFLLMDMLKPIKDNYDYIVIDSPPSLGSLTINAFCCSDYILIPLQAELFALNGMERLIDVVGKVKKRLNKTLKIGGVFATQYDNRKILNKDLFKGIKEDMNVNVFDTTIRTNVALAEAQVEQLDIFRYNDKSNGASDYMNLCEEIIRLQ